MAEQNQTQLEITGVETQDSTVSVDVLIRLLDGMQQIVWIIAAAKEQTPVNARFKPAEKLRRRYRLRCGLPGKGSYLVPLEIVDEERQRRLIGTESVLPEMLDFVLAAGKGDADAVKNILPGDRYRDRAFRVLRAFAPKRGERWSASLRSDHREAIPLNGQLSQNVDRWLLAGLEEQATMTVTGELIAIKFDENKLFIRHPVTNRQVECSYLPETEVDILESRRDLIQVTGQFTLDSEGHPLRLTNVTAIEPVDLSPLEFAQIELSGRRLKAGPPLTFAPELDDETRQLYVISDVDLDLHVFAYTRDQLIDELTQHLFFIWDAYANADPETLTPQARELGNALQQRFQELS